MSFTSKLRSEESQYKLVKQIITFVCSENNLDFSTVWSSISNKDTEYFDRYHRREKKKNEPLAGLTKPRTAFSFFTKENRCLIAAKHPTLSFGEISKLVGEQWKKLNESTKKKYINMQDSDRVRYNTARQQIMDDYAQRTRQEQELRDAETQRQASLIAQAEEAGMSAAASMSSSSTTKKSKSKSKAKKSTGASESSATPAPAKSSVSKKGKKKGGKK